MSFRLCIVIKSINNFIFGQSLLEIYTVYIERDLVIAVKTVFRPHHFLKNGERKGIS